MGYYLTTLFVSLKLLTFSCLKCSFLQISDLEGSLADLKGKIEAAQLQSQDAALHLKEGLRRGELSN